MSNKKHIFVAEDSDDDFYFLERAFSRQKPAVELCRARDGISAVEVLRGYLSAFATPDLILLDLKIPGLDGLDVLRWIRAQDGFRRIAVVILSSSDQPENVCQAYDAGATSFLVKPGSLTQLQELVEAMSSYWFKWCVPPPRLREESRFDAVLR